MNKDPNYQQDLASIRQLMERSSKFISLSGLSGILAGTYALIGAAVAYYIIQNSLPSTSYRQEFLQPNDIVFKLLLLAIIILVVSILTGYLLSSRKAKQQGMKVWDVTSKRLAINLFIPLFTGGLFILILLYQGYYEVVTPASLIFYGLALINASANLYEEIRYLGYSEIVLGLLAALLPGYGLLFWAIGFGALHIFYGALMFRKYDR